MWHKRRFFLSRAAALFLTAAGAAHAAVNTAQNGITVLEDFEKAGSKGRFWEGSAVLTGAAAEEAATPALKIDNGTQFAKLSGAQKGAAELVVPKISVAEPSILSFRVRTEVVARYGQVFTVYLDDLKIASPDGVDMGWRVERVKLAAGTHTLRFELVNSRGARVLGGCNAVYIDDITLFLDKIAAIALHPRGEQHTYLGAQGSAQLRFRAEALLPDGSPKSDAPAFAYRASGGSIDENGLWTPAATGSFTVTATLGNFSIMSSRLAVHPADFLQKPVKYSGTGKTYAGYLGGQRADNAPPMPGRESLTINAPAKAEFDADAFFLLEGAVRNPRGKNYARVLVRKEGAPAATPLDTWYIVQNEFSRRIWLPFGPGAYHVELIEFDSVSVTAPQAGEGAFRGGSYSREPLAFTVYNTREEEGVDGDGRWLYPSFNVQSDDFRVLNLLNDITTGVSGEREKILAIHDRLVSALVYDTFSFRNNGRSRKMDALSVIETKTAVCEGYAQLSAALLRAAGISARLVVNKSLMHAWNQVWTDGGWKMYDATWDDPVPDRGPSVVSHAYFLPSALSGGDNRHRGSGSVMVGDVE
jgi:hypothetical protein